ncbi:MAG: hypothetical protein IPO93_08480 [Actinobacteria bacterium]|nr:hypothetical protein [Actinomycetota bacterium]
MTTAEWVGSTGTASLVVTEDDTAIAVGSGDLPVFATPIMIALMEAAACEAVAAHLAAHRTSVGTRVEIRHSAPSMVGTDVTARAEVVEVHGSRLTFAVSASHTVGGEDMEIGAGTHVRVIVDRERFLLRER